MGRSSSSARSRAISRAVLSVSITSSKSRATGSSRWRSAHERRSPTRWHRRHHGRRYRSAVNLAHLAFGPLHRVLGGHALDGLGVHVDDDVLGEHLGSLRSRRSRMAIDAAEPGRDAVGSHYRVLLPHLVVLPLLGGTGGEALLHVEPLVVDLSRGNPLKHAHRLPPVL